MDKEKKMNESGGKERMEKILRISKIVCIISIAFLLLMQFRTIRVQEELINQQDELIQQMDENLLLQEEIIQKLKEKLSYNSGSSIEVPDSVEGIILTSTTSVK